MKNTIFLSAVILFLACNSTSENPNPKVTSENSQEANTTDTQKTVQFKDSDYIDMKSLFELSPLSIFDQTTEGLSPSEKEDLLKKDESEGWKIVDSDKTKLTIESKTPASSVTLHFLRRKDNLDGLLFASINNEKNTSLQSWIYKSADHTLQKAEVLKNYSANDFVSSADRLPGSYTSNLIYQFVNDETIEVSLNTWMDKAFENRAIVNSIFLHWDGKEFMEKIVKKEQEKQSESLRATKDSDADLSKLEHEGKIVFKRFWEDANGKNAVLFTRNEEELFVYHYTLGEEPKLWRKVYDFEKDCEFDQTLAFIEESIGITDLDNNNIGELTFAYQKACRSDVSPLDLKLLMLENGDKYIIRGTTSLDYPGFKMEGSKNIDPSFMEANTSFLAHANAIWENIKIQ